MQGPSTNTSTITFKQAFLKNLLLGLQQLQQAHTSKHDASSIGGTMGLHERKRDIKSSADHAMAAAHCGQARWPKAILASAPIACKVQRCRRIVRAHCHRKRSFKRSGRGVAGTSGEIARRLVRRRTMALREVIPGGRDATVDEATLLWEAVDYVVHLRFQVDVLRQVSQAVQRSSSSTLD